MKIKIQKFSILLFAILLLIQIQPIVAQVNQKIVIKGNVVDSLSNKPIEFASVVVYKSVDNSMLTGSITNNKGEYTMALLPGKYYLKTSFVGYKTKIIPLEFAPVFDGKIAPITLTNSVSTLGEVEIVGEKIEKQISIEKTKIDVSQNISAVTGSVTDLLKSQSSVTIDAENNIYLRGNSNILVLLDGRPTTVTALNSLPSGNIESIEIITNPDAKYDAEGTGGIINIVSKRQDKRGVNGTITLNYGVNNRMNGGLGLNFNKGIWAVGFNYNGRLEKPTINSVLSREIFSQDSRTEQNAYSSLSNPTHIFNFSVAAKPNNKNRISLTLKSVIFDNLNIQNISGLQLNDDSTKLSFNRTNEVTWKRRNIDVALSYRKIFEKNKQELSFDAMYSLTKGARTGDYTIENTFLQKSDAGGRPQNTTIQVDYFKQIFKTGRIETGVKAFSRWNSFYSHFYELDSTGQWLINQPFSNDLDYKENIYSTYLMYSDSLIKKIFYKIGARVEYNTSALTMKSTGEEINREYFIPFPFAMAKFAINKEQSVSASVTRRVTRPIYSQLNPYIVVIDQITYETGNRELKPEIVDKLEVNYSFVKDKFQFRSNLFYGITNDFITQVSVFSDNKLIVTYANGNKLIKSGVDADATFKLSKYFSLNPAFSFFYSESNGNYKNTDLSANGTAWTGNLKAIIRPDKKSDIQFLINYNSPIELPQFKLDEIYYTDIAIKRNFLKNNLTLSFTVTDVFNSRQWIVNTTNSVYSVYNKSKNDTRIYWFGITYNFNSYKPTNGKVVETENEGGVIKLGQ